MICLRLFWEFFKTGLFAFGGWMATVPFLSDMGARTGWFTQSLLADMIAVSESTPGPIGVNMATYVGYTTAGVPGGIIATLGLITPSILIFTLISAFLKSYLEKPAVRQVLYGIRPASTGLIAAAGVTVLMLSVFRASAYRVSGRILDLISVRAALLFAVMWVLTNLIPQTKKLHPILYVLLGAVVGAVFRFAGA